MNQPQKPGHLRWPLKHLLDAEPSPIALRRIQEKVNSRWMTPRNWLTSRAFLAPLTISVGVVFLLWIFGRESHGPLDEALRLADGKPFHEMNVAQNSRNFLHFEDGSSLEGKGKTKLELLGSDQHRMVTRLSEGSVTFNVKPGGSRQWVVEAGLLSVEVVGTIFTVERNSTRVGVTVTQGSVLVRSGRLPDGVLQLKAGQNVEIRATPEYSPVENTAQAEQLPATRDESAAENPAPAPVPQTNRNRPNFRTAPQNTPTPTTPDDSLRLADEARVNGDIQTALSHMLYVDDHFPNDPRSAITSFQISVLEAKLGKLDSAELRLTQLIAGSASPSIKQDAYLRLVELQRTRSPETARKNAHEYLRVYPDGRHVARISAILAADE